VKLSMILFLMLSAPTAFAASASRYTSVAPKDCRTIESSELVKNPEIDYYTGHCPGFDGYTVVISGGDLRYSLGLIYRGRNLNFTRIGSFHEMGSTKIEWRGPVDSNGGVRRFNSLIYRLSIQAFDDQPGPRNFTRLFVVRLNGTRSCLIGTVEPSATMNAEARAIADDLSRPCLRVEE